MRLHCGYCGSELRVLGQGYRCFSQRCQLRHDENGKPLGWVVSAGSIPGDLLPYEKIIALTRRIQEKTQGEKALFTILHISALVALAVKLQVEHHSEELVEAFIKMGDK